MSEQSVTNGVVITHVVTGPASRAGIRKGDIILSLDGQIIHDSGQFNKLVEDLPAGKSVAVLVQRNGSPTFLALKVPGK